MRSFAIIASELKMAAAVNIIYSQVRRQMRLLITDKEILVAQWLLKSFCWLLG